MQNKQYFFGKKIQKTKIAVEEKMEWKKNRIDLGTITITSKAVEN